MKQFTFVVGITSPILEVADSPSRRALSLVSEWTRHGYQIPLGVFRRSAVSTWESQSGRGRERSVVSYNRRRSVFFCPFQGDGPRRRRPLLLPPARPPWWSPLAGHGGGGGITGGLPPLLQCRLVVAAAEEVGVQLDLCGLWQVTDLDRPGAGHGAQRQPLVLQSVGREREERMLNQ